MNLNTKKMKTITITVFRLKANGSPFVSKIEATYSEAIKITHQLNLDKEHYKLS